MAGPLGVLDGLGPAGLAAVAAAAGIGLVGVGALVGYLVTYLTSATAERVGADLREAVFGRLLGLGLPFHDRHRSGDLVTRLTGDVARVEDSMVAWFTVLVPEVLTLAGMVVVVLASTSPSGSRRWPQLAGPPAPASRHNPRLPAALDRAIATLLTPDPGDRPATAAHVFALLADAMPADAAEEDRLWPIWATGRLGAWRASTIGRPPVASRPA